MSQHDNVIDNQAGAAFRADLNAALQASASNQSGSSAPTITYPYQFWADTANGVMKIRNAANTAWLTVGLLDAANFGHVLPGAILFHAKNTAPPGYLKANGGAVSRSNYQDLFNEIGTTFGAGNGSTTFNVPDLRGEILRGWDDARGVDVSRAFGSAQGGQVPGHQHKLPFSSDAGQSYSVQAAGGAAPLYGVMAEANVPARIISHGSLSSYPSLNVALSSGVVALDSAEVRMRNVALLACIKY
ncbi:tail collar domain [Cupriavidus alkaliphilus]|uniref:phage tail protein n=1 Tax=Cupriavidus alkaliphilus TaxID=942866 RepID=UPI000DE786B4|nr:phage tail protein [Cupriavidus alkaliphilus]PVY81049.1 tail collar domain [Cupriavidus alkaliphilus]